MKNTNKLKRAFYNAGKRNKPDEETRWAGELSKHRHHLRKRDIGKLRQCFNKGQSGEPLKDKNE